MNLWNPRPCRDLAQLQARLARLEPLLEDLHTKLNRLDGFLNGPGRNGLRGRLLRLELVCAGLVLVLLPLYVQTLKTLLGS